MPKAIGYIRVSTSEQATDGVSLDAQRAKITAWAMANDYEISCIYEDAGITGTSLDKRRGLRSAIAQTGKGMALVSYSISRIARSTRDMLQIADQIQAKGADLVSLTEKIDTTTAAGKMVFRMLAVLSEFERDVIAERTTVALAYKKSKREVYSPTPFGFNACNGQLLPSAAESEIIARIRSTQGVGLALGRAHKAAGLPYRDGHELGRHAFAARWLAAGKGMKGLQLAGGWKKFSIPADIYGHLEMTDVHSQMRELSRAREKTGEAPIRHEKKISQATDVEQKKGRNGVTLRPKSREETPRKGMRDIAVPRGPIWQCGMGESRGPRQDFARPVKFCTAFRLSAPENIFVSKR